MKAELYHSQELEKAIKESEQSLNSLSKVLNFFKIIVFKRVGRKSEVGRCVLCDARNLCGRNFKCKSRSFDEQYQVRWLFKNKLINLNLGSN